MTHPDPKTRTAVQIIFEGEGHQDAAVEDTDFDTASRTLTIKL